MNYLPDTNACISYLNNPQSPVRYRMERLQPSSVFVCSVVKAELYFGVINSRQPLKNREKIEIFLQQLGSFPFDDAAALLYGEVRATLSQAGRTIGPYDLQIAAIALERNLILVTHNTEEFSRVDGLKLEDWEGG
jgi:tRNA(fMet)-specific endonuclease VapC